MKWRILAYTLLLIQPFVYSFFGFHLNYHSSVRNNNRPRNLLHQHAENIQRIIQAGGGLPTNLSGNFLLFDPEKTGKLKGSGQCSRRIHLGCHYQPQKENTENNRTDDSDNPKSYQFSTKWSTHDDNNRTEYRELREAAIRYTNTTQRISWMNKSINHPYNNAWIPKRYRTNLRANSLSASSTFLEIMR